MSDSGGRPGRNPGSAVHWERTLVKPPTPLQELIDPFVTSFGGELVANLIEDRSNSPHNADYLFRSEGVIAELKALQDSSFNDAFRTKMGDLSGSWHQRGLLRIYGTQRIHLDRLPPVCQQELINLIAGFLQNNLLKKANQQIRATKDLLGLPDARGLLVVASDGNEDLAPFDVVFFLNRLLQKRHPDGRPQFSSTHAILYFNPRMPAVLPSTGQAALLWNVILRESQSQEMARFLDSLGNAFVAYMEKTFGVSFPEGQLEPEQHRHIKFAGITPKMPRIQVNYDPPEK
jgi:hypothetical protein